MTPRAAGALCLLLLTIAGCGPKDRRPDRGGAAGTDTRTSTAPPRVGEPVRVGRAPTAVAVGGGTVWVANNTDGTVTRLDARTHRRVGRPVPVSPGPRAITFGAGAAWVASGAGFVERVTAGATAPAARTPVADPAGLAVSEDTVWVSSRSAGAVLRLDARTGRRLGAPIRVGRAPTDVATTSDGVWVANSEDGSITRIDPRTAEADAPVELTDGEVLALAAGVGTLWAAVSDDPLAQRVDVLSLDPGSGDRRGGPVPVAGGIPVRLAADEAAVWVTGTGSLTASGRGRGAGLTRLAAAGGGVIGRSIDVGERPAGLAVGEGSAWVADQAAGTVVPVTPR